MQYRYSIYGWVLVSAVVEAAAAEPFPKFLRREVFQPLGMDDTVLDGEEVPRRASPYFPRSFMRTDLGLQDAPPADYSCFAGAGAFLSTPADLVRFGSAMLKPGLLKAETIALLQTPLRLESGASSGRTGLEGRERAACRRAGTAAGSPRQSDGWHHLAPDVPGSRLGDCRRVQRVVCQGRCTARPEGRGDVRETGQGARSLSASEPLE